MTFVDDNPGQPRANLFGSRRLPSFPCTEQTLLNRILRVVARMQNAEAESIKPLHIFLCDAGKRIGFHTPLPPFVLLLEESFTLYTLEVGEKFD